jgi:L-2-hydroxyglutarate oxidase
MSSKQHQVAVVGGGIVGLATARAIQLESRASAVVLEAEERLATHQTGHNSGVIHSGLYYKPGSLKARNCAAGRDALYRFCAENEIAHENCGKIVVATTQDEVERLEELVQRGRANGLHGLRRLDPDQLREYEPHVRGVAGLHVPETGIVDFTQVAESMARQLREGGGKILTGARVRAVRRNGGDFVVETTRGAVEARFLINCAGLQCDRVARLCGLRPRVRIVPFRGEYYKLVPQRQDLVRHLIYPVPDPRFPFLGVHFTRMVHGGVEAGPNAVLAFKREGYGRFSFSGRDTLATLSYRGFWRMASRHWRTGFGELYRSFSRAAFVRALQKLLPDLRETDVERHGAGVRAQAVAPDGALLDDFHVLEAERMLHVLNAPSPAATASLSIGNTLARRAAELFGIQTEGIEP